MHIYNWYHSITTSILLYTRDDIDCMYTIIPLAPLVPLFPLFDPPHLLGTLLAVTGSVHLVPGLLVN
jgi:hypothetical protein